MTDWQAVAVGVGSMLGAMAWFGGFITDSRVAELERQVRELKLKLRLEGR